MVGKWIVLIPSPSPTPAGDLIHIQGNPKVLLAGVLCMLVVGVAILASVHKNDGRNQGKGEGWR
jgi:hypothetical protein